MTNQHTIPYIVLVRYATFLMAESMIAASEKLGISEEEATRITIQTIFGAACMLRDDGKTPTQLCDSVTSPGGTTEAALRVLDEHLPDILQEYIDNML